MMHHADGRPPGATWDYDDLEKTADAVIHAVGVAFAVVGLVLLVVFAQGRTDGGEFLAAIVYAASLLVALAASAAYNVWPVNRVKWLLRRFDHSAIYGLIAGTYTPFIAQMKIGLASVALMAGIWITAALGVALKLLMPGRFDRLSVALYIALGWSGIFAYEAVAKSLPPSTMWLLAAGGILYTAGVVFHAWRGLRFQNVIWHGFVLAAAACHYVAVLDCLVLARPLEG